MDISYSIDNGPEWYMDGLPDGKGGFFRAFSQWAFSRSTTDMDGEKSSGILAMPKDNRVVLTKDDLEDLRGRIGQLIVAGFSSEAMNNLFPPNPDWGFCARTIEEYDRDKWFGLLGAIEQVSKEDWKGLTVHWGLEE